MVVDGAQAGVSDGDAVGVATQIIQDVVGTDDESGSEQSKSGAGDAGRRKVTGFRALRCAC